MSDRHEAFRALHRTGSPLLLPNAWDHASAAALARAGFPAIGTTSLGVAAAAGKADATGAAREETLRLARGIARLPALITVDIEGGFGDRPDEVADLARELTEAGVVGVNLEDGRPDGTLTAVDAQCALIRAVKDAVPDLFVARTREGWRVELNSAALPRVLVNRRYHSELKAGAKGDKAGRAWLSEKLQSANWLVKALDQRAQTMIKVGEEIVRQQQGFFEQGVAALRPLTLAKIAEAIEMHESTVSRVTTNKYLSCDRGLFELKYFFGSGVASDDGEGAAAEAVKAEIKRIIDEEVDILSDDAIAALLKDKGYDIARRTVVKYREAIGFGSSVQRRRQRRMTGG